MTQQKGRFSKQELEWIEVNRTLARRQLHSEFCIKFSRSDITARSLEKACEYRGWSKGRARTAVPIGSERICRDGFLIRKFHDGLPANRRWRPVHLVLWEQVNGLVPAGHLLKCLDGNKLNTDPSNWKLISRCMIPRLSGVGSAIRYDDAQEELKPLVMAAAELDRAVREAKAKRKAVKRFGQ